ncbi:MAG: YceI family protein [Bacteroidetes bacterium HGW-Bacteroidetes-16]|jgi:polyisoprenoid-binding protein YceI|nr:MAG: YceI family protein [Bacteroidetes bacterium HGW-Bacteroidetes-16]
MKKLVLLLIFSLTFFQYGNAQRYLTKNGQISFFSDGPLEKIEAQNNQVNSVLDVKSGDFVFKVLMKSFLFEKALMQEHFNENYVESDQFPNATFVGKITNPEAIDFTKPGTYDAILEGKLSIHGVTKQVKEQGTFQVSTEAIVGKSVFIIKLADYNISIPGAVAGKIAEEIEIRVDVRLDPLKF